MGLAYAFDGFQPIAEESVALPAMDSDDLATAIDAERSQPSLSYRVRSACGHSWLHLRCPEEGKASGVFLIRSYDAGTPGQYAVVRVGAQGRIAGELFESYANPHRRFAQDALWIEIQEGDCEDGTLDVDLDSTDSPGAWSEIGYKAVFYGPGVDGR